MQPLGEPPTAGGIRSSAPTRTRPTLLDAFRTLAIVRVRLSGYALSGSCVFGERYPPRFAHWASALGSVRHFMRARAPGVLWNMNTPLTPTVTGRAGLLLYCGKGNAL